MAACTCLALSCLFSHPSSRHKIQDFLCGSSYNATLGPPPTFPFSPPALQGSGCHSVFPVTTLLVPSSAVSPNLPPYLSVRNIEADTSWCLLCSGSTGVGSDGTWSRLNWLTTWGRSGRHGGAKIISITCCMTCDKTTGSLGVWLALVC